MGSLRAQLSNIRFFYQYKRLIEGVTEEEAAAVMLRPWEPNEVWQRFMEISGLGHLPA